MKLEADRAALAAAAKTVASVVRGRGSIPVLQGVRIDADAEGAQVTCTDLDVTMTVTVPANVMDEGSAVVPASTFASFLAAGSSPTATLVLEDGTLVTGCGSARAVLPTYQLEEWPKVGHDETEAVHLDADAVVLLQRVLHAADDDPARPFLTGVRFHDGHVVATDTRRLAAVDVAGVPSMLVPAQAVAEMCKASGADGLRLGALGRNITFVTGATRCTMATIEAKYPDNWPKLVPASTPHCLSVDRDAVLAAIKRVTVVVGDDNWFLITLDHDVDKLVLSRVTEGRGSTEDRVEADGTWPGPVKYNSRYLVDLLKACEPGTVDLRVTDNLKPMKVESGGLVQVLMPVRA